MWAKIWYRNGFTYVYQCDNAVTHVVTDLYMGIEFSTNASSNQLQVHIAM